MQCSDVSVSNLYYNRESPRCSVEQNFPKIKGQELQSICFILCEKALLRFNIFVLIHIAIACHCEIFTVEIKIKWDGGVFVALLCYALTWAGIRVCVMQPQTGH